MNSSHVGQAFIQTIKVTLTLTVLLQSIHKESSHTRAHAHTRACTHTPLYIESSLCFYPVLKILNKYEMVYNSVLDIATLQSFVMDQSKSMYTCGDNVMAVS